MGGVPSKILDTLWLGGVQEVRTPKFIEEEDIHCVLSVCQQPVSEGIVNDKNLITLWKDVQDHPGQDLRPIMEECVRFIHTNRLENRRVFVHCMAGISRSTTMTIAYFVAFHQLKVNETLQFLTQQRSQVGPNGGFMKQLAEWEAMDHSELRSEFNSDQHRALIAADLTTIKEVLGDMESGSVQCKICKEGESEESGLIVTSSCEHQFHKGCFKEYAATTPHTQLTGSAAFVVCPACPNLLTIDLDGAV